MDSLACQLSALGADQPLADYEAVFAQVQTAAAFFKHLQQNHNDRVRQSTKTNKPSKK